jgi:hypothetical protein
MDELEMRLQALMRQEYVPTPQIRVPQENDMDDLQERLYRLEPRHRQLQISDYPLLRNRMIYESMGNIPIVPETYNVADPVGELRNIASSRIQRHNRHKLTRGRRLNKAKNRLSIAKIPELDYDTARLLGEKYIKKGGANTSEKNKAVTKIQSRYRGYRGRKLSKRKNIEKEIENLPDDIQRLIQEQIYNIEGRNQEGGANSSELSNEQEQFDEFLTGIREPYNPYPDMAKSMTALRNIDTPLHNIDDLAILDRISSYVGPARIADKLKRLKTSNMDLILNFKSDVRNLNDRGLSENEKDTYYAGILYRNTNQKFMNRVIRQDDFTITTIQSMFNLPDNVARLLIYAILEFEDEIDPAYSEVTLPRLLKYLIISDNLNNFITSFKLLMRLNTEYSEIEKETFINNFLKMIQP